MFGRLIPEGQPSRLNLSTVRARFEAQQKSGEPLNTDALDRALLLADDLPGVTVAGALHPGAREGETDLVVKLADEPPFIGEVAADNTGSRATGEERLSANLGVNSPLGIGDQLAANLIHARGSDYARLAWSLPVGSDGWRIGANASRLDYKLVVPEFTAIKGEGDSTTIGLEASYPLIRSRLKNLFLSLAVDRKDFDNRTAIGTTSRYRIDVASLGLIGNLFDQWGGGGANSASLSLTQGRVDLGHLDAGENPALDGGFTKLRYSASRQQVVTPDVSVYGSFSGQETRDNLDSSEQFYLGGANGVRAYPANEGGGASGQLVNLELRWRLPQGFMLAGLYDWGRITQNADNGVLAANPNTYRLKGHGLALAWAARSESKGHLGTARRRQLQPHRQRPRPGRLAGQEPLVAHRRSTVLSRSVHDGKSRFRLPERARS